MDKALNLQNALKEANRCLLCTDAPCSKDCPAGTNPAKFIRQIKFMNYKGAARTIKNNNVLGSVCAHICPAEKLCQKNCSASAIDCPINIKGLQQFAYEYGKKNKLEPFKKSLNNKGKVAIIGAGPAGMSCAAELAKIDYDVTIFEKEKSCGGVPKFTIPNFRLPKEAVDYDIKNLLSLGVKIKYNSKIKSQDEVKKMLKKGYKAVFIGTGLSEPFELPIYKGYTNALDYITFLRSFKENKNKINVKNKIVAVIGGGSVAFDSANSAAHFGAKKVYLITRRSLSELPADEDEIALGHKMHIIFKPNSDITEVNSKKKTILGLKGNEVKRNKSDKYSPIPGTDFNILVDYVIQAVGTMPGKEVQKFASGLKTKGKGVIVVKKNYETNIPGIFAGGDVVNGGKSVVEAIGVGQKAATSVNLFIKKQYG